MGPYHVFHSKATLCVLVRISKRIKMKITGWGECSDERKAGRCAAAGYAAEFAERGIECMASFPFIESLENSAHSAS